MRPSLQAAREISRLWLECLNGLHVELATCPSDDTMAAIIDRYCPQPPTPQQT
jgi:hypothetical protein